MTKQELLEEMRQDIAEEDYKAFCEEHALRTDWDFVLQRFPVNEETTVEELIEHVRRIREYGWDITALDLLYEV